MTRKEIEDPTEVEIELKRRLGQLTDHLIQKQAQVFILNLIASQFLVIRMHSLVFVHMDGITETSSFSIILITPFHGKNGNFLLKYCTNKSMKTPSRSPKPFTVKL